MVTVEDLDGTLRSLATRWRWTTARVDGDRWRETATNGDTLGGLTTEAVRQLGGAADDGAGPGALLASLEVAGRHGVGEVAAVGEDVLHRRAHATSHLLSRAGRVVQSLGGGSSPAAGTVVGVHTSAGGVPKTAVDEAMVSWPGLIGDRQRARRHHGRLWQAVCLWSVEVIDALRDEGHELQPGAAGENLTVSGVDWADLAPGTVLRVGSHVRLELSAWATPCAKNARWFVDGNIGRMGHDRHPGWSRAYASVRAEGLVRRGDRLLVEPAPGRR